MGGLILAGVLMCNLWPAPINAENAQALADKVETLADKDQALQLEIKGFNDQITYLLNQIADTDKQIATNKESIAKTQTELKKEQEELGIYLEESYQENQTSFFENLMKAENFSDFVDRREYLDTLRTDLSKQVIKINILKHKLETDQKNLAEMQVQNALAKASLDAQVAAKQKELADVQTEEARVQLQFAMLLSKGATGSYCKNTGHAVIKAKYPIFNFPTDCGYVSQGFGNTEFARVDKAYNGAIHNGVDVGINVGTPIKSIGNGTVFAKGATPSGGWGNWVMVKHDPVKIEGKDLVFYSLYGHMITETTLKIGDKVNGNTLMGVSGGTPYWAPHLHFSLFLSDSGWTDGTPGPYPGNAIDPLDYMDIPISTAGTDWDVHYAHGL